jgi:tetratricopeptide (TPR) repeat protein
MISHAATSCPSSRRWQLGLALVLAPACGTASVAASGAPAPVSRAAALPAGVQAISFLGDTLRELPLAPATRRRYEEQLADARAAYDRAPANADSIIWLGRRLAYLGRFREAIDVYTRGITLHPNDARLYRHRGHRYLSVREPDHAVDDLERATRLVAGAPDEVEPDGQPNARNQPIGTLQSNIAYHLGLAYYLKGDFAHAVEVYRRELAQARNDDRRVSTAHWLYMSLRRLGREREADEVLLPIRRDMEIVENDTYHRLLLMYKGVLFPESLVDLSESGQMSVTDATAAYGVANWHLYNGRPIQAERIFRRIVAGGQWGAFGYITAEAELARMR